MSSNVGVLLIARPVMTGLCFGQFLLFLRRELSMTRGQTYSRP